MFSGTPQPGQEGVRYLSQAFGAGRRSSIHEFINSVPRPECDLERSPGPSPGNSRQRSCPLCAICGGPARRLAVSDPVFRGTRVPVHLIAELVAQGSKPAELIDSYPRVTDEMIRLAPVYAAAYPLRGPKRKLPWRDHEPVRRGRRKLDTIAVS